MTSTTRIPKAAITGLFGAMVKRFSKQMFGEVPEPLAVMWHNRPVLDALVGIAGKAKKWKACAPNLKSFAHMAVASQVGCSFCLDAGYFQAHNEKLDLNKAREVPRWRESGVFTPLERDVMEYAEAMTRTPPTVTDELSESSSEACSNLLVVLRSFSNVLLVADKKLEAGRGKNSKSPRGI